MPSSLMSIWVPVSSVSARITGAALANHVTDLLRVDLDGDQARSEVGQLGLQQSSDGLLHFAQDMLAAFFSLCQCNMHDFFGDAVDLDVHLQRGNAVGGTSYLEVHVAQVVFVAQDVGQHGEARRHP